MIGINTVKEFFIEKKKGFNFEAMKLKGELGQILGEKVDEIRIINNYIVGGLNDTELERVSRKIIGEVNIENIYYKLPKFQDFKSLRVAYHMGQFDQKADSAEQVIKLIFNDFEGSVKCSKMYFFKGCLNDDDMKVIEKYLVNKVDSRVINDHEELMKEVGSENTNINPKVCGFLDFDEEELVIFSRRMGLAMDIDDLKYVKTYFKDIDREPTIAEVKVLDTYWSDHCRHTTFNTELSEIKIVDEEANTDVKSALDLYRSIRNEIFGKTERKETLMDIATIGTKYLNKNGIVNDIDESKEINACSVNIQVDNDGKDEDWLLMFKNETHNHPTEIEPFGGAATCLGGAIRDPLSGRSYVYGAIRVTGSGDPREKVEDTIVGKLPQRKITKEAARGYSSYGNQIGIATGLVKEYYHQGYKAKRMEIGGVIGAVPKKWVRREEPSPGDVVILIGGRTGRDGIGGAAGSSKAHDSTSMDKCGAEVQKGNAPEERKLQRLYKREDALRYIKKCNDFGAGGVSVAIGEIADGIIIELDKVRKKYEGLTPLELAISESQERMAVVVERENVEEFIHICSQENLEAYEVGEVTKERRIVMNYNGERIVDISRDFIETNGADRKVDVLINNSADSIEQDLKEKSFKAIAEESISSLKSCSQKGLHQMFDGTIGSGTVLMPYGGRYFNTPSQVMVQKIPVEGGKTTTVSGMTYGFNIEETENNPYKGAVQSITECLSKMTASGFDYRKVRLSFQEYFQRMKGKPENWGKVTGALLGGLKAQIEFGTPAIGGKDSMSGSFENIDVPPTLVAFGAASEHIDNIISPELKETGSKVVLFKLKEDCKEFDFKRAKETFSIVREGIRKRHIISAYSVSEDNLESALCKMCFGNKVGVQLDLRGYDSVKGLNNSGAILCEIPGEFEREYLNNSVVIGEVVDKYGVFGRELCYLEKVEEKWKATLNETFPENRGSKNELVIDSKEFEKKIYLRNQSNLRPKVVIPVFPGTNCEFDSQYAFERAGAQVKQLVFKNLTSGDIRESVKALEKNIRMSNILMIPGGFSAGDQPDGSGKFISSVFKNQRIKESVMEMLYKRDGLILGICNGFQALVKLGLLPFGEIKDVQEHSPTLTYNASGTHISKMVKTKIISNKSPWMNGVNVGDVHTVPISHGEGRFVVEEEILKWMMRNGQIATVYEENPNGSTAAIEGITSSDGRIFGKMAHSERIGNGLYKNITGNMDQKIFESGVEYFK